MDVPRFVAVRERHDWPMQQSAVIVECLSRAGSVTDEMSSRFRDCDPGPRHRLLREATRRRPCGTAKIAHRCASASGRVLDTRPAQPACEVGYLTLRIGFWRSLREAEPADRKPYSIGLFQFPQFGLLAGLLALEGAASRVGLALSSAVSATNLISY